MLTIAQMQEILAEVSYRDWSFIVGDDQGHPWLQVSFEVADNYPPFNQTTQTGRKWRLSRHMCKGELVQTALAAVLAAEEHEARELFHFQGASIFDGHYDPEALVRLRKNPISRQFRRAA